MDSRQAYDRLTYLLSPLYGEREARNIARIVFEDAFGIRFPGAQSSLSPDQSSQLDRITQRLLNWEPVQYVLGMADFYGMRFKVDQRVLIPRPETEELVEWGLQMAGRLPGSEISVLDIGTGSGCIPIVFKKKMPRAIVWALDVNGPVIELARENAALHQVDIHFLQADILQQPTWDALPSFDLILSNPPYIPESEKDLMEPNVTAFEPGDALFVPNEDPLLFYRVIGLYAHLRLRPEGVLLVESHQAYAREVAALWEAQGWRSIEVRADLSGRERMVKACA